MQSASSNAQPSGSPAASGGKPMVDMIEYPIGHSIIREGELGDCAYILTKGEVEVVKENADGREVVIAILGANEIFGEMCLFDPKARRSATVRVITEKAEVMVIDRRHFQAQVNNLPDGMRNIIVILIDRLRRADSRIAMLC
jgi:CRP/FNR family cyclic AMP-dependent transcriptional regulator